ncbi:Mobile element protein [Candidatus Enterovibrio altilux]|uniref:Mobile element protein n=1 Tax=Candidatus Enterovibrio altilux TaxID=1927128 RepID=A0A291B946_9GAMM|nr:Mobile element protein [Candidatus Enterovibrio luxaltus]
MIDAEAIQFWNQTKPSNRGRPRWFSDSTIVMALMVKRVFSTLLRGM